MFHKQSTNALFKLLKQYLVIAGLVCTAFTFVSNPINAQEKTELILARAPQSSPLVLYQQWTPFVESLSKTTNIKITLKVYKNRSQFENALLAGEMDLLFCNPYYYHLAHEKHGYISLVRNNRKGLEGILLVRADSEVRNISQLNDKVIAFPSPNAFAASLYLRAYLVEVEGINFEPFYVGTHDNVYRQISSGQVIAGGGIVRTLNFQPDDLRQRLKIIYRTELLASHPLSTSPLVSERQREAILSAIFQLSRTDEGKALLKTIKLSNPIRANHDLDYAPLGKMNISKYASIGKD